MERIAKRLVWIVLACAAALGARAEPAAWEDGYRGAFEVVAMEQAREVSPLALEMALAVGRKRFSALDVEAAAGLALVLASGIDADLRSGCPLQESLARSSQLALFLARDIVSGGDLGSRSLLRMRTQGDAAARTNGMGAFAGRAAEGSWTAHGRRDPGN